jgi:hypothetical protein
LLPPLKSLPTSGPLTVSSQVTHAPHGIGPPEQFIWVPLLLTSELITSPKRVTTTRVVPLPAAVSYAVAGSPNAPTGPLIS